MKISGELTQFGRLPSKQGIIQMAKPILKDKPVFYEPFDLNRYDGEHCLAQVNGETFARIPRADVVDLMEAVNAIVLS